MEQERGDTLPPTQHGSATSAGGESGGRRGRSQQRRWWCESAYHSLPPGHQLLRREDGWVGLAGLVGGTHRWEEPTGGRNVVGIPEMF